MNDSTQARRLILQVLWSTSGPGRFIVQPGQTLRVGREQGTGLPLPHDVQLSKEHFELTWDGERCRLRDLGSTTGTWLDGQVAVAAEVFNKSWIRAGSTDFSVFIEDFTPPKTPPPPEARDAARQNLRALRALAAEAPLFAILDAARTPRVLELLQESVEEYQSLYEGPQGQALADVAPYLLSLPPDSRLLEALVHEGWMQNWGIYLTCPLPFLEVRRHLRRFLMVETEEHDEQLYFRFYDPRVLRIFLPTCSAQQREEFLGPIQTLAFEPDEGNVSTHFSVSRSNKTSKTSTNPYFQTQKQGLTNQQIKTMADATGSLFERSLFSYAVAIKPSMPRSEMSATIALTLQKAKAYKLTTKSSINKLLKIILLYSPAFLEQVDPFGHLASILNDPNIPELTKRQWLETFTNATKQP